MTIGLYSKIWNSKTVCNFCSACHNSATKSLKHGLAAAFASKAFVCLLIHCKETVQFMQFVQECCLAIEYIQYKMVFFPQEYVQSVQCTVC